MIVNLADLDGLETAEAFLDHFGVAYDRGRLMPLRVPLLRRFRRYLSAAVPPTENDIEAQRAEVRACLIRAYREVVEGTRDEPSQRSAGVASQGERTFIPLAALAPLSNSQ